MSLGFLLVRSLKIIGAVLALCACPKPRVIDRDAGPLEFVGRECNVDAECGSLRCDKIRHQCICLSDQSCVSGDPMAPLRYCNNYTGLCVTEIAGCKNDSECDSTSYCDPSIRACRPLKGFCESCLADNECGGALDNCVSDLNLMQKFCATSCQLPDGGHSNAACPRGATCISIDAGYQCWPTESPLPGQTATCKNFKGCTPDSLRTCNNDMECGDLSQRCDPAQGKCVAIEQVCPFGTTCDPRNKICVADCAVDSDCGDPSLVRCVNRVCELVGECTADTDCPANKICSIPPTEPTGTCAPFCQGDVDCPIGQTCQLISGRYKCASGCSTNQNCPLDQRCNLTSHQCEGPIVGTARICQSTSSCNTCEVCDPMKYECVSAKVSADGGSVFPHCQMCSSPSECGGGTCVQLDDGARWCLRYCVTGSECPQGFVCLGLSGGSGLSVCVPSSRTCGGKCP